MRIILKENEVKEVIITDSKSVDFSLSKNSVLTLKFVNLLSFKNVSIKGRIKQNAKFTGYIADFSTGKGRFNTNITLDEQGAKAYWDLASLSSDLDDKEFDISFIHNAPKTIANMNNYGVSLNSSRLHFAGVNYIQKGCVKSNSNQNAKIIVFDKDSKGRANPVLRIDENDVLASHSAVVGRLNDEHLFYLKTRGLNEKEAKALIIGGYLKPIAKQFDNKTKEKINKIIERKCHV